MSALNPWVSEDLTPSSKKTSLVDDVSEIIKILWDAEDTDGGEFRSLLTSTDKDDAVDTTVNWDKARVATMVWEYANQDGYSRVAAAKVGEIARVMHWAARRYGKDRKSIAAKKADYLLLSS